MGFNCGIVGLPNVGKSSLFNALTQTAAAMSANYPFCTIEPNVGRVAMQDDRLDKLASLAGSKETLYNQLEFVDIAGLVKGASKGEGLGNQFLGHIREVDAIVHVLRCFENDDITHVEDTIDPIRDAEIINTELVLADLESVEKRLKNLEKKLRGNDKDAKIEHDILSKILTLLNENKYASEILKPEHNLSEPELNLVPKLQLITTKPLMYVCNVAEDDCAGGNDYSKKVIEFAANSNTPCVIISAKIEEEIANLDSDEDKKEFLLTLGLEKTGLQRIINTGFNLLNLITFFTVGPKEARAWTVKKNSTAPKAAGVIHTDFEKGFIRAETISYEDYINCGSETKAKDAGKMRLEGKEYIVNDGDIFHFRFNN